MANIDFIQRAGLLVLHIPASASESAFAEIPDKMAEKLGMPGTPPLSGIVVDLDGEDMNATKWKKLAGLLAKIPGRNRFFVVGVSKATGKLIQSETLNLDTFETLEEVFQKLSAKRGAAAPAAKAEKSAEDSALEKLMVKTFQESAIKTLEVQCSTNFKAGTPKVKDAKNKVIHDIAASMGLMSKSVSGSVALGFQESTFLEVMGRMLGEKYDGITSEVEDGCGELLNIIFGQAKKVLSEKGHLFGKTLPSIFVGHALRVRQLTPNPAILLPFESEIGKMVIEIGYRRT